MVEFANWVGQSGRHFLGTLIFIGFVTWCLCFVIAAIRGVFNPGDM